MRTRDELEQRLQELRDEAAARSPPANDIRAKPNVVYVRFGNTAWRAHEAYLKAYEIDEDPKRLDEADGLYREAIRLDPTLAVAHTNLGNMCWRKGEEDEAVEHYRAAVAIDPSQPEGNYNLGYVLLENDRPQDAVPYLQRAVDADPRFADAHYNLAEALERVNARGRARLHWVAYLELEPQGEWAELARSRLWSVTKRRSRR